MATLQIVKRVKIAIKNPCSSANIDVLSNVDVLEAIITTLDRPVAKTISIMASFVRVDKTERKPPNTLDLKLELNPHIDPL